MVFIGVKSHDFKKLKPKIEDMVFRGKMSKSELLLMQNEDGTWGEYDDTWDITIHCTSEQEHDRTVKVLQAVNSIERIVKDWANDLEEKSEGDYYMQKIEDLLKAEDEKE